MKRPERILTLLILAALTVALPAFGEPGKKGEEDRLFPDYTFMTNYFQFATNDLGQVSSNEFVEVVFEDGTGFTEPITTITNFSGGVSRYLSIASTNAWGHYETNYYPMSVLRQKVRNELKVNADQMSYDNDTGWIEAKGHVVITKGSYKLKAVYVRLNRETEKGYAAGDVVINQGGRVIRGQELNFDINQKVGVLEDATVDAKPFRIVEMESVQRQPENTYVAKKSVFTTCTNEYPHCHYHVSAGHMSVIPEKIMRGRKGKFYFMNTPIMYVPFWKLDLRPDFGWKIYPGHSSRLGAHVLSSYQYRVNPALRGETHGDIMSERGFAVGQDFRWNMTNGIPGLLNIGAGYGEIETYYLNDQKPLDDDEDLATSDIEENRYKIFLKQFYSFSPKDSVRMNVTYLSDTDVLEDFFEDEFRIYSVPDNYFIYSHRGDNYNASVSFRGRVNDFFKGINRLPEAYVDFLPQQIGNSYFMYEGRTAVANLEQVYKATDKSNEDYGIVRFDTQHLFSRPKKYFGFLQVIPRAGYRGTYFSETREGFGVTNIVTTSTTNTPAGAASPVVTTTVSTNSTVNYLETEAMYRNVIDLGAEFSFKAFRQFGEGAEARRHIIEPYLNYSFRPEPDVLPDRLYPFDGIDNIDETHLARIGVRNKWQKKIRRLVGHQPHDIFDVNLYTYYIIEREESEDPFQDVFLDIEWRPNHSIQVDVDARYDLDLGEINAFNARSSLLFGKACRSRIEYRYRANSQGLLFGDLTLWPGRIGYSPSVYARYEMEKSRLEETGFYLRKTLDCMVFRTGLRFLPGYERSDGTERDDEFKVTCEFWLTAFPEFGAKRNKRGYDASARY